jgi:hypothetical protein
VTAGSRIPISNSTVARSSSNIGCHLITLATEDMIGNTIERLFADAGHNAPTDYKFRVYTSGQKHRLTPQIKRELRRRAAIEPVIGHLTSASALDFALHPNLGILAQRGGDLLRQTHASAASARRLPIRRRAQGCHQPLRRRNQCRSQTVRLDC